MQGIDQGLRYRSLKTTPSPWYRAYKEKQFIPELSIWLWASAPISLWAKRCRYALMLSVWWESRPRLAHCEVIIEWGSHQKSCWIERVWCIVHWIPSNPPIEDHNGPFQTHWGPGHFSKTHTQPNFPLACRAHDIFQIIHIFKHNAKHLAAISAPTDLKERDRRKSERERKERERERTRMREDREKKKNKQTFFVNTQGCLKKIIPTRTFR